MTTQEFLTSQLIREENGDLKLNWTGGVFDLVVAAEMPLLNQGIDLLFQNHTITSVIEIGFGLGITAQKFQDHGVQKHYILEPHPILYEDALTWRETQANKDNIFIINQFFQEWDRKQEDGTMTRADLVYYDAADPIFSTPDFVITNEQSKQVYFKWADVLVAGYARQACFITSYLDKYEFVIDSIIYYQPYKIINN